jgi:hypothetical protein
VHRCLEPDAATGAATGDERVRDVICRGTFASLTENPPTVLRSVLAQAHAVEALPPGSPGEAASLTTAATGLVHTEARLRAFASDPPCSDPSLGARIVRAEAEAIAAMTRAFTVVGADDVAGRRAVTTYVREAAAIMDDCLDRCRLWPRSGASLATECLGRIAGKPGAVAFVPPTNCRAARDLAAARARLAEKVASGGCAPGADRDCGEELACLGWRRAVDVVMAGRSGGEQ